MPVPVRAENDADDREAAQFLAADRSFDSQFSIFSLSIIKLSRYLIIVILFSLMTTLIYLYIFREEIMKTLDIFSDYL